MQSGKRFVEAAHERRRQRHLRHRGDVVQDDLARAAAALQHRREPPVEALVAGILEIERRREQHAAAAGVEQLVGLRRGVLDRRSPRRPPSTSRDRSKPAAATASSVAARAPNPERGAFAGRAEQRDRRATAVETAACMRDQARGVDGAPWRERCHERAAEPEASPARRRESACRRPGRCDQGGGRGHADTRVLREVRVQSRRTSTIAATIIAMKNTSVHAGIARPRKYQPASAHSPLPLKTLVRTSVSGSVSSM